MGLIGYFRRHFEVYTIDTGLRKMKLSQSVGWHFVGALAFNN